MSKRKNIIMLGLLLVFLTATCSYVIYVEYGKYQKNMLKRQKLVAARHHLLCEVLKPGMSVDEVVVVLRQAGEFTLNKADWTGGRIELGVNFTDPKGRDLYGAFELGFSDYKYARAYVLVFDKSEAICNFSQATP